MGYGKRSRMLRFAQDGVVTKAIELGSKALRKVIFCLWALSVCVVLYVYIFLANEVLIKPMKMMKQFEIIRAIVTLTFLLVLFILNSYLHSIALNYVKKPVVSSSRRQETGGAGGAGGHDLNRFIESRVQLINKIKVL